MKRTQMWGCAAVVAALASFAAQAQSPLSQVQPGQGDFTELGQITQGGEAVAYVIHRLPPNAFPELPAQVALELTQRGCMIPQTYEAHRPENVVHASLERPGSSDWAVLCSAHGEVSLLVFFASAPEKPMTLATAPETERLQSHDGRKSLGFDWGIDPASPQQVHDAQSGMDHRPPRIDHDALGDSVIEVRTKYHFFTQGRWTLLDMPLQ